MTDEQILALARKGYTECGLRPVEADFYDGLGCACVLGAAIIAADAHPHAKNVLMLPPRHYVANAVGRHPDWVEGCINGFDGEPQTKGRGDAFLANYTAGYEFGQRARAEFLEKPLAS